MRRIEPDRAELYGYASLAELKAAQDRRRERRARLLVAMAEREVERVRKPEVFGL